MGLAFAFWGLSLHLRREEEKTWMFEGDLKHLKFMTCKHTEDDATL